MKIGDTTETQVEAHNQAELWKDAAEHVQCAQHSLGLAQGCLEDLGATDLSSGTKAVLASVAVLHEFVEGKRDAAITAAV